MHERERRVGSWHHRERVFLVNYNGRKHKPSENGDCCRSDMAVSMNSLEVLDSQVLC